MPAEESIAALVVELDHLAEQVAALSAEVETELPREEAAPWNAVYRALAERVLPLSLRDQESHRGDRRFACLQRQRIRLLREGATLREQSAVMREHLQDLAERCRAVAARRERTLAEAAALMRQHRAALDWAGQVTAYQRMSRSRRFDLK